MKPSQKSSTPQLRKSASPGLRYKVPNLERGLLIMEHLMNFPQGLQQSEIATQLHYSKTSVFRVTMTLLECGYLIRDEETKALRLSRKLIAMGNRTLCEDDLVSSALDIMKKVRDEVRETVLIGTVVGTEMVVLAQVLGSQPFKFSVDLGTRLPIHSAAPGKAILAWLPNSELKELIEKIVFVRFNERTITTVQDFMSELEQVRRLGYALDRGEQLTGIHCVAAPIYNRHGYPIAAIWTTGPADRLRSEDYVQVGTLLKKQADAISGRLGYGLLQNNGTDRAPSAGPNDHVQSVN